MKNLVLAAVAATSLFAAPAMAKDSFTGPRVEVTAGYEDVSHHHNNLTYGVDAGYDVNVGPVVAGVEAGLDNVFDRRNINVAARLGVKPCSRALVYATAGYANYRDFAAHNRDGLRVGGGVEVALFGPVYTKVEYRHEDFGATKANGVVGGVGFRF